MALHPDTESYIATWKPQLASYNNNDDVNMMIEKLRVLFQIYNRLYNEVSNRLRKPQGDRIGATEHVVEFVTADALVSNIEGMQETRDAELRLRDFIRHHTYHFELKGPNHDRSDADDNKILAQMESASKKTRMEGLLYQMYKVRCNLVHGQKHLSSAQLPLMQAVIPILERVVEKTEEKLRA